MTDLGDALDRIKMDYAIEGDDGDLIEYAALTLDGYGQNKRRLEAHIEQLEAALRAVMPFLEEHWCEGEADDEPVGHFADQQTGEAVPLPLTFGQIKACRQALQETSDEPR